MERRRRTGVLLCVLAAALLGLAVLLFVAALGAALSEEPIEPGTSDNLGAGALVAGIGFLAALAGSIYLLVSARKPPEPGSNQRSAGPGIALGIVGYLAALYVGLGLVFQNMNASSGSEAPVGSIVLILSLGGFVTVFAGGLAAFTKRGGIRFVVAVTLAAVTLFGAGFIVAHAFGTGI